MLNRIIATWYLHWIFKLAPTTRKKIGVDLVRPSTLCVREIESVWGRGAWRNVDVGLFSPLIRSETLCKTGWFKVGPILYVDQFTGDGLRSQIVCVWLFTNVWKWPDATKCVFAIALLHIHLPFLLHGFHHWWKQKKKRRIFVLHWFYPL